MNDQNQNDRFPSIGGLRRRRGFCRFLAAVAAATFLFLSTTPAFAGTDVLGGNAVLTGMTRATLDSNDANAAVFSSPSASAVLDWSKFNVGSGQSMTFNGAGTTFFNLVDGAAGKSQIDGMINGSGNVWVINPAGIAFGAGSTVDVGGLFAAAAGNVENAAELRAGTATTPAFSSFAGTVDASKGSFTADQVALMGKTVTAGGAADFAGSGSLSVGATTGALTVDEVGGGKVTIDIGDFADADAQVKIGDLLTDGDVEVQSAGGIEFGAIRQGGLLKATATGSHSQAGSFSCTANDEALVVNGTLQSTKGSIGLYAPKGDVYVMEDVMAANDIEIQAAGGLAIGAGVLAAGGSVTAEANLGVVIGETGFVGAGRNATVVAYNGDVNVNGGVLALQNANVYAGAVRTQQEIGLTGSGSVTIKKDAGVVAGGILDVISAGAEGDGIQIDGVARGVHGVVLMTNGGKGISSGVDAAITAGLLDGDGNFSDAAPLDIESVNGDIRLSGVVQGGDSYFKAANDAAQYSWAVDVGNTDNEFCGKVSSDFYWLEIIGNGDLEVGDVAVHNRLVIGSETGDITVSGTVQANNHLQLQAIQGDIEIEKGAKLKTYNPDGSEMYLYAASGTDAKGELIVNGEVSAAGALHAWAGAHEDNETGSTVVSGVGRVSIGNGGVSALGDVTIISGRRDASGDSPCGVVIDGSVVTEGNLKIQVPDGDMRLNEKGKLVSNADGGLLTIESGALQGAGGNQYIDGQVLALNGTVEVMGASGKDAAGDVFVGAEALILARDRAYLSVARGDNAQATLEMNGSMATLADDGATMIVGAIGKKATAKINIGGKLMAKDGSASVTAAIGEGSRADVTVGKDAVVGAYRDAHVLTFNGNVGIEGEVIAEGDAGEAKVWAKGDGSSTGNVFFGAEGQLGSRCLAELYADGNVVQNGAKVAIQNGRTAAQSLPAAIEAKQILLKVNGSVGDAQNGVLAVDGAVRAKIGGDAYFAAAGGADYLGAKSGSDVSTASIGQALAKIDEINPETKTSRERAVVESMMEEFGALNGGAAVIADGSLSVYTAGKLEPNGLFSAGGDLTISAASFGDMSYLQAGGTLTINNVGNPAHPQIAYFESVNGREPKINNQPNDTVIFVDGRLAGGNLSIINKFGATEAFPVATPELKSEQGIFGNPVFLHGDLDVANPMAVGNVDYMLQEIPRLTLASDFPLEIDKSVNTAGLNPKDVYRFGQHAQVADEKPQAEQEEKKDDKASAEKPAEPKVAMR